MKAICAWCQREGCPAFLGEREPLDDDSETHGVCRRHLQQMLAGLPSQSFPEITYLFVVREGETALCDYLERAFLAVRGVKVIMDRRRSDRRGVHTSWPHERRRTDRRQPRGVVYSLGYTTVRFRRGPGREITL